MYPNQRLNMPILPKDRHLSKPEIGISVSLKCSIRCCACYNMKWAHPHIIDPWQHHSSASLSGIGFVPELKHVPRPAFYAYFLVSNRDHQSLYCLSTPNSTSLNEGWSRKSTNRQGRSRVWIQSYCQILHVSPR